MHQHHAQLEVATPGRGLVEITPRVSQWLVGTAITTGLLTIFIRHTSASLLGPVNAWIAHA